MKRLTIAIDYDDTFTADPQLWSTLINLAKVNHRVVMVTARRDTEENNDLINTDLDLWNCSLQIFFTNLSPKIWFMEKQDIDVDIWIDDNPQALVNGH